MPWERGIMTADKDRELYGCCSCSESLFSHLLALVKAKITEELGQNKKGQTKQKGSGLYF